jgi:hypothetical protein
MTARRLALAALGSLAALLAGGVALELAGGLDDATAVPDVAPTSVATAATEGADQVDAWSQTILDRPLFAPSRRPPQEEVPVETVEAPEVEAPPPVIPRLAGIIVGPQSRRALFQPADGGKPLSLGEGDEIAGWVIEAIAVDGVRINGAEGQQTITPQPDAGLAAESAVIAPVLPAPAGGDPPEPAAEGQAPAPPPGAAALPHPAGGGGQPGGDTAGLARSSTAPRPARHRNQGARAKGAGTA